MMKMVKKIFNSYNEQLVYEGEYSNGKKLLGKEYDKYGELIFEGEYLNGEKWKGKGIEYNNEKEIIFEGEY